MLMALQREDGKAAMERSTQDPAPWITLKVGLVEDMEFNISEKAAY
jgi:hypothetical protein